MTVNQYFYPYTALTGGGDGALDSLDGALLKDGDAAFLVLPAPTRRTYVYTLDADSGATESSPAIIAPDQNAGTKRWVLTNYTTNTNDVKYYGAIGDGTTDDRSAVNDANTTADGYIQFTPGTYKIGSNLTLTKPIRMDPGAKFLIATGVTLTLNCPISADCHQIFSWAGTGKVLFGSGKVPLVYAEWWGAVADGSTDNSAAMQACFDAVIDSTHGPRIYFNPGVYSYATGLVLDFPQGMNIKGVGGYWTPSDAGYNSLNVTTLKYTGSLAGFTIGDGSQNATGLVIEQIYYEGTANAGKGVYFNTVGGIVMRDCTFGMFTKSGGAATWVLKSQLITFDHCGWVKNYYGAYHEGNASEITQMTYNNCVWHSNTNRAFFEECGVNTRLINPTFQDNAGPAIVVNATAGWNSQLFKITDGYFSNNCVSIAGYEIDILGDDADEAHWHKQFTIRGTFFGTRGAQHTAYIRLQYTDLGVIDNLRISNTAALMFVASAATNNRLSFDHWNNGWNDSVIQNGSGDTVLWPKQTITDI